MPHPYAELIGLRLTEQRMTMNYFKPVRTGVITCTSKLVNRGKAVAHLESQLYVEQILVASANGNFSIFTPSARASD